MSSQAKWYNTRTSSHQGRAKLPSFGTADDESSGLPLQGVTKTPLNGNSWNHQRSHLRNWWIISLIQFRFALKPKKHIAFCLTFCHLNQMSEGILWCFWKGWTYRRYGKSRQSSSSSWIDAVAWMKVESVAFGNFFGPVIKKTSFLSS